MSEKNGVVDALRVALSANPGDTGVRLHLADLLVSENIDLREASEHYVAVLATDPAHVQALRGAARAFRGLGDDVKAQGYEKLLAALGEGEGEGPGSATETPQQASNVTSLHVDGADRHPPKDQPGSAKVTKLRVVDGSAEISDWDGPEPVVTLADVGGMDHVKKRLHLSFLAPLQNPQMMETFGKSLRGGLLLYGPPGCGKTFIARALAGELGAKFMSVGLSDVLDMWMGESERKLHEIFETARRQAPAVLFFDEIDALGRKRSQIRSSAGRTIVNQLLAEMDSVGKVNEHVFVLAATNHPWDVDTALRRPGRFDRSVLVLPPDEPARQSILAMQLKGKPMEPGIVVAELSKHTDFFSGADLVHLCETALEYALEASLTSGDVRPISQANFHKALQEVKPSTRPWFDTAKNYAMFANEGGSYDDLLDYIKSRRL